MRKFAAVTLMASLLSHAAACAFWPEATDSSLEVGVGYRRDKVEWKTSSHLYGGYSDYTGCTDYYTGFDGTPGSDYDECCDAFPCRAGSHLKWKNLNIWQIEAVGKYVTCDNIYLRFNADYGWITSGKNSDRDYFGFSGDNCDDYPFASSHSKVKGHVYDVRLAAGYQFKLCDDTFSITPLVGYSWHGQHLKDRHLRQSFDCCYDETFFTDFTDGDGFAGTRSRSCYDSCYCSDQCTFESYDVESYCYGYSDYCGSHSKYNTRWNGPFIGFDFDYRFGCFCEWDLFGTYEFHWAQYHAKGKWDLRTDLFDGFNHHAKNAYGSVFDIGIKWDFCDCWTLALKGEFQWWWADKGRDRALIAEGSCGNVDAGCFLRIPLRDVKWQSAAVTVDIGMVF